jgi:hypothetical protein
MSCISIYLYILYVTYSTRRIHDYDIDCCSIAPYSWPSFDCPCSLSPVTIT